MSETPIRLRESRRARALQISEAWQRRGEAALREELVALAREQGRDDLVIAVQSLSLSASVTQLARVLQPLGYHLGIYPAETH